MRGGNARKPIGSFLWFHSCAHNAQEWGSLVCYSANFNSLVLLERLLFNADGYAIAEGQDGGE